MKAQQHHLESVSQQSGAALIVGLLILLLMTIIGLSSIRNVTLEEQMVANSQYKAISFQAAETALIGGTATIANSLTTLGQIYAIGPTPAAAAAYSESHTAVGDTVSNAITTIVFDTTEVAAGEGYSLKVGGGGFEYYLFDLTGTGDVTGAGAQSVHLQGVKRIAPGS